MRSACCVREVLRIRGVVQGVGFRPTVWRTARRLGLAGEVWNDAEGVVAVVEGPDRAVAAFPERLRQDVAREAPLARIDALEVLRFEPPAGGGAFVIAASRPGRAATMVPPDAAVCPACLREMFDPADRRWRHAFTNCTHCGPRFTITHGVPYDRARTSMAVFPMCSGCRTEYGDPADRRFHAQPVACPDCGPVLRAADAAGRPLPGDPVAVTLECIRKGGIVAVKGIGGLHLVCDAGNERAVRELRRRKGRSEKALALMCANPASACRLVRLSGAGIAALCSPAAPIVLAPRRREGEVGAFPVAPSVAPGHAELGVMLPYAPVQHLLFHEFLGRPAGGIPDGPVGLVLVMTSANPGGEPLVTGNDEALLRLCGIADAFLLHDREIVCRCDDSVVRDFGTDVRMVRRARGFTPEALAFPDGPVLLALGAERKNAATVTRGGEAWPTAHVGDLDAPATVEALEAAVRHFLGLLEVRPEAVACDLHPDFASTRLAERLAREFRVPLAAVQHHHAHAAAVLAEHARLDRPAWGLVLDGTGLGTDGAAWGGELLLLRPDGTFERRGHLRPLPLPGGDRAAREPRRMGAAAARACGREAAVERLWPALPPGFRELLARPELCPRTTSLGRLFDAAAAILGIVEVMRDEAHAAVMLESAASGRSGRVIEEGFCIRPGRPGTPSVLDFMPLFGRLIDGRLSPGFDPGQAAADFEATVAGGLVRWVDGVLAGQAGAGRDAPVVLAGGCLLNRVLSRRIPAGLRARGHEVLLPRRMPPGDGAVSFGQAAVLRQRGCPAS